MGNLRVSLTMILIVCLAQGCAFMPRKTVIINCINLAGELYEAYCQKPQKEIEYEKSKDQISEEITKSYAQKRAKEIDPKGEIFNVANY